MDSKEEQKLKKFGLSVQWQQVPAGLTIFYFFSVSLLLFFVVYCLRVLYLHRIYLKYFY